jgi:regulator of sigma E protease
MLHSVNGIILAILSLGFIIFIHELGHFLAAKRCGIRVDKFSIGFGPKLIGFKRGETEYCLSLLPFGGFVKMPGENPEERTGAAGEFSSASVENRMFVVIAGPVMNFAFGIIAFSLVYMITGEVISQSSQTTQIGFVADDSPAKMVGIQPGDEIVAINGKPIRKWEDLQTRILTQPGKELEIELIRNGQKQQLYVTPKRVDKKGIGEVGQIGVAPRQEVLVHSISAGSWAATTGLQPDDLIEMINGNPIYTHRDFYVAAQQSHDRQVTLGIRRGGESLIVNLHINWAITTEVQKESEAATAGIQSGDQIVGINSESPLDFDNLYDQLYKLAQANPDQPIQFELLRGGEKLTAMLTPKVIEENRVDLKGLNWKESVSGLELTEPVRIEKYNVITAWGKGVQESWLTVSRVFSTLGDLITKRISPRYLAGPIGIVTMTARIAQISFRDLLLFVGFISVNLGIVNLLPIPIADGGQMLFFTLEKLRGKPLGLRKQVIIQQVSIVLLIGLFLYITVYDILRVI